MNESLAEETRVTPAAATAMVLETMRALKRSIDEVLVGRYVRVISDHNGQPFGRSRRSWRGEMGRIKSVDVDLNNGVSLLLEGHQYECFIPADEVEFT